MQNSKEALDKCNNIEAKCIETYDFSNFFPKLPLDTKYDNMKKLIENCFT